MSYNDTYFLSAKEALKIATQKNNKNGTLQVCYYDGEVIDSELVNLVHLPIDSLVDDLATGTYRIPSIIDFTGVNISEEIKVQIENNFYQAIEYSSQLRIELNKYYISELKNKKLNFEETLRFYLVANSSTQVMQYVSSNIASTLKNLGFEVLLDIYYGCEDNSCLKKICDFNPHITININHLNNSFLSNDVFNFIWFQDPMPFLLDKSQIHIRKKDFVFSLLPFIDKMLYKKGIPFQRQGFCINDSVYKINPVIKREKKIVFIGSSYSKTIPDTLKGDEAFKELKEIFLAGKSFTNKIVEQISLKYTLNIDFVRSRFIPYIVRDIGVLELCKIKSDYQIEIYGWGWESYEELKPYIKGDLKYGQEIADVYSSATFAFAPHQQYTLQQRTFEASACGAIPIVYDCRDISHEDSYEDALVYYKTNSDLEKILSTNSEGKNFTRLLSEHTYGNFVEKILKKIDENK